MALKAVPINCPSCGATVEVSEDRTQIYCTYCGTKIMIQNDHEYIYRHIDEAEVKYAETERMVKMRQMDIEEIESKQGRGLRIVLTVIWIILSAISVVASVIKLMKVSDYGALTDGDITAMGFDFVMGITLLFLVAIPLIVGGGFFLFKYLPNKEADDRILRRGGIKFPMTYYDYTGKEYKFIQNMLRNAGFTNITCVNKHDLKKERHKSAGRVEFINVNGENVMYFKRAYMPDDPITITYHGK